VGDTTNWEFAAAVAAVSMGLGGLLLFALIGTVGSWRVLDRATRAAADATSASMVVQDLARYLAARESMAAPAAAVREAAGALADIRLQADALIDQQSRLQDAVRNLVEAGVLRTEDSSQRLHELEGGIKRLEEHLARVSAAVAGLSQRR
jgi:hypothetical protein